MAVAFVKNHPVASNKTAGTTLALTLDTAVPAGNLIVARAVFDNAGTTLKPLLSSIGVAAGETNTWATAVGSNSASTSAGAFASGALTYIYTTVTWPAGSYTMTLDTSVTMKAGFFQEFSGTLATLRSTSANAYSTTTTAATATTTGTAPVIGDLALGLIFQSNTPTAPAGDNDTTDGSWSAIAAVGSAGSTANSNNHGSGQYKILTGTSHQTLNNSAVLTAGNGCIVVVLQQYVPPSITQAAYRFYADGTETGSTALANQDTGYTADTSGGDVNLQVRTRLQSTTAIAVPTGDDWQLQWEKNTSGTWTDVTTSAVISEYPESNLSTSLSTTSAGSGYGQSFMGNGRSIVQAEFWMQRFGSPTGTVTALIYAHTGTFGAGGFGTGTALATSSPIAASSAPTTASWVVFAFDGSFLASAGTPYVVTLLMSDAMTTGGNEAFIYADSSTPTHPGNETFRSNTGVWSAIPSVDVIFRLSTSAATTVVPYASANLTDGAVTTNRLGAGTGSFVAGKISEDGLVDDLGWTANNHTEVLYSVTLKQADLAPTDTLRFRVLRNGATTGLTYTQVPTVTIGAGGPTDRTGTATGLITVAGTASGVKEVTATATGQLAIAGAASGSAAAAPVLGTATGTLTVAGVAAGVHGVAGTATGSLAVAGAASGQKTVGATATGALTVAGTATGVRGRPGTATGTLTVAGVAAGTRATTGTATGSLTVSGVASGAVSGAVTGQAAGTLTVAGTASGIKTVTATATGQLAVSGVAVGVRRATGIATGSLSITGVASGQKAVTATAAVTLTVSGTATGQKVVRATATGQIVVASIALGLVEGNAVGRAIGQLTIGGTATGRRGVIGTPTGAITVTGLATGHRATTGTATGLITIAGIAVAVRATVGTATGTFTVAGVALGHIPIAFDIQGEWNGQAVDAMQWGDQTVVDWYMLTPT